MRFIISLFEVVKEIVLFIWERMSIWSVDIGYHYLWWMVVNIVNLSCFGKFPILISAKFNKNTYSLQGNRIQSKWIFKRIYIHSIVHSFLYFTNSSSYSVFLAICLKEGDLDITGFATTAEPYEFHGSK